MKPDIHPVFYTDAKVVCACGNTWVTGSTRKVIHTDVCSNCHPFYTGEQRIVDTEGQVDRFYKKLQARQTYLSDVETREAARISPNRPIAEFELGTRATEALAKAGITKAGQVVEKLSLGDDALLSVDGFGRKSLADLKKRMRTFGYTWSEVGEEITV